MYTPFWETRDGVMNEIEFGFVFATDESSPILHRFIKAVPGTVYDLSHNYWSRSHY